jgi:hypothetical protein
VIVSKTHSVVSSKHSALVLDAKLKVSIRSAVRTEK